MWTLSILHVVIKSDRVGSYVRINILNTEQRRASVIIIECLALVTVLLDAVTWLKTTKIYSEPKRKATRR